MVSDVFVQQFSLHVRARNEPLLHRTIMTATVAYIVLLAVPFMPAIEIGLGMILVFGPRLSVLIYLSTITALVLAYLGGRLVPPQTGARIFRFVGLTSAERLLARLAPLSGEERLDYLLGSSPAGLLPYLIRYRYLALALLLNLPGNMVVGGGGGIGFLAGMTRLFAFPQYLLTVALAVAPVPLIIYLTAAGSS
jgi:hypothetical protein